MIYIGIDPGLGGAVAIVPAEPAIDPIVIHDTPVVNVGAEGKIRRKPNVSAMASILRPYIGANATVILESVHAMPRQGVSSSFTFGEGLGIWKGIIAAFELPLWLVSPQRWKKEMMADQGREKSAARYKAMQLFPEVASQLSRVKDDGRAEALLMAAYGKRVGKE